MSGSPSPPPACTHSERSLRLQCMWPPTARVAGPRGPGALPKRRDFLLSSLVNSTSQQPKCGFLGKVQFSLPCPPVSSPEFIPRPPRPRHHHIRLWTENRADRVQRDLILLAVIPLPGLPLGPGSLHLALHHSLQGATACSEGSTYHLGLGSRWPFHTYGSLNSGCLVLPCRVSAELPALSRPPRACRPASPSPGAAGLWAQAPHGHGHQVPRAGRCGPACPQPLASAGLVTGTGRTCCYLAAGPPCCEGSPY